jgi:hypothetical protein
MEWRNINLNSLVNVRLISKMMWWYVVRIRPERSANHTRLHGCLIIILNTAKTSRLKSNKYDDILSSALFIEVLKFEQYQDTKNNRQACYIVRNCHKTCSGHYNNT